MGEPLERSLPQSPLSRVGGAVQGAVGGSLRAGRCRLPEVEKSPETWGPLGSGLMKDVSSWASTLHAGPASGAGPLACTLDGHATSGRVQPQ